MLISRMRFSRRYLSDPTGIRTSSVHCSKNEEACLSGSTMHQDVGGTSLTRLFSPMVLFLLAQIAALMSPRQEICSSRSRTQENTA